MSTWYQHTVTCLAKQASDIAKFLQLSETNDVWTDSFTFSFGGKNHPGLRLGKIVEQNPDLIFLVKKEVECDAVYWWIDRFDESTNTYQHILLSAVDVIGSEFNEKILEEYEKTLPGLAEKHFAGLKGYEEFRWEMFFDYHKAETMLKNYHRYTEMITPLSSEDLIDNDYSHLLLDAES